MASFVLPDTVHGGSITVQANNLADAQKAAASQTGASLAQQQGGGTFGINTNPNVGSSGGGGGGGGGAAAPPSAQTGANLTAAQMLLNSAQQAAYQAYLDAKLHLDTDTEAYQKAAQEAATKIAEAGVTGTYNGMPTQAAIKQAADLAAQQAQTMLSYATTFGTWGTPTQGEQTLAAQKQATDLSQQYASTYGQYYMPGTAPTQGQTTLAQQQQAYQQWLDAQKQSLAQWTAQQSAAQNYLTMMAGLRGPADYMKYQQVLGATPGGMKDLVAAAAGQYIPGGGATTGVAPTPVSLQNFLGSATSTPTDTSGQAAMQSLVAPNQMAPQTWNALTPSQQQMLLGTWESQGYTKEDAQALFNQSLPKYAAGAPSAGQFKLQ
ncbi:MAG TPA: hypothetical protein VFB50_13740 [Chloroflexota bacterium]|nr:hypothetical protein [Chloroflexota bacterium]